MKKIVAAATVFPILVVGGIFFSIGQLRNASLPKDVEFIKNGQSEYVIVRSAESEFAVTAACSNLSRAIKKQTGADIKVITDKTDRYESGAKIPCEIIVGDTNREIECEIADSLLYDDFAICVHGQDLVLTAGNPKGYEKAADYVADNLLKNGNLSLPENFVHIEKGEYAIESLTLCGKDISDYTLSYTNDTTKAYVQKLSETVREKTGVTMKMAENATENAIIFDTSGEDRSSYAVACENGNIRISSPTGTGLTLGFDAFSKKLFGNGEKIVKTENIEINGKISEGTEYSAFIMDRGDLSNTYNKLTKDKKLTVAYFGGSVTVGHASSDRSKYSWRARTTAWLAENFPEAQVVEINSAIGASGSHLGAFRVQRDIIAHKPDLVFVEYSINDGYNGETEASAAENFEAIVRSVRKALPECDIITSYSTDSGRASGGGDFAIKNGYEKVAKAYDVPAVDVGKALITKKNLKSNASPDWSKYFTDIVHMNDTGFEEYTKVIAEYLKNELICTPHGESVAHSLPEKVYENADRELQYILATEDMLENAKGFTFEKGTFENGTVPIYEGYLKTTTADNSITFTFTGSELSLFMSSYTSGTVTYEIDGKKWRADRNSMNNPFPIVKNLEYGEHTITMQFGFKDSTSANIGAFLVR